MSEADQTFSTNRGIGQSGFHGESGRTDARRGHAADVAVSPSDQYAMAILEKP